MIVIDYSEDRRDDSVTMIVITVAIVIVKDNDSDCGDCVDCMVIVIVIE